MKKICIRIHSTGPGSVVCDVTRPQPHQVLRGCPHLEVHVAPLNILQYILYRPLKKLVQIKKNILKNHIRLYRPQELLITYNALAKNLFTFVREAAKRYFFSGPAPPPSSLVATKNF